MKWQSWILISLGKYTIGDMAFNGYGGSHCKEVSLCMYEYTKYHDNCLFHKVLLFTMNSWSLRRCIAHSRP